MSRVEATVQCPDCGGGLALIMTSDGVGWYHVGQFDEERNVQTVYESCPT